LSSYNNLIQSLDKTIDVFDFKKSLLSLGVNESLVNERMLYAAGFNVTIFKNFFELYIPLVYSKDIKDALNANNKGGFFDTMRFTLNLHNIKPKKIIETNFF
jgi:hypothetical protein